MPCEARQASQSHCATQCINSVSCLRDDRRRMSRVRRPASGKSTGDTRRQCPSGGCEPIGKCLISSRCHVVPRSRREMQRICRRSNRRFPGEEESEAPRPVTVRMGDLDHLPASGNAKESGFQRTLNRRYKAETRSIS